MKGGKWEVELDDEKMSSGTLTVKDLKQNVSTTTEIPAEEIRLIYAGQILSDTATLDSYNVKEGHAIHLVRSVNAKNTTTTTSTSTSGNNSSTSTDTSSTTTSGSNNNNNNAFPGAGMFGGMGMGGGMEDSYRQMMQNPEMMRQMMNSPMMQNIMNNPESMMAMMESDPNMQQMMDQNPQIRHALRDPNILRQTMDTMQNPRLYQEMMRNNDRAMSNLESHPGGFNLLRQMYTDVQEPMMNAAAEASATSNPFASLANNNNNNGETGADGQPLMNPWARSGDNTTTTTTTTGSSNNNNAYSNPNPFSAFMNGARAGAGPNSNRNSNPDNNAFGNNMTQLLQNPAMQEMMTNMMNDPQTLQAMMQNNPYLRNNPQFQDPQFMQRMMDPQNLQSMIQLQQAMSQLQNAGVIPNMGNPMMGGGDTGNAAPRAPNFANMFAGMNMGGAPQNTDTRPPAERFATQIQQLKDMGFYDEASNIQALTATNGNVNMAVERLLNNM